MSIRPCTVISMVFSVSCMAPLNYITVCFWQHSTSSKTSEQNLHPLDVPKELWRLVDYIYLNGLYKVSYFEPYISVFH